MKYTNSKYLYISISLELRTLSIFQVALSMDEEAQGNQEEPAARATYVEAPENVDANVASETI